MVSITEKDKNPEFICIVRVKFKPAKGCAYTFYQGSNRRPLYISRFSFSRFLTVLNTEPLLTLCIRAWWRKLKWPFHEKKKKKTVIWGEVRQLFFTLNTEKIRGKHNRVEWPGSRVVVTVIHWSQSVMNLPHAILFSNTYWILFWKKERIMVYSRIARKKINNTLNSQCAIPMKIKLIHGLHGCEPNLGPPGKK